MINFTELRRCTMFTKTKFIKNSLLIGLGLFGMNVMANSGAVVEIQEVQAEQGDALNLDELRSDISMKNCGNYDPGTKIFRLSTAFLEDDSPIEKIENCLGKAMDKSLKPICDEERNLKNALKEGQHDSVTTLEEIEGQLAYLEEVKYEYAQDFYDYADGFDDLHESFQKSVDNVFKEKWLRTGVDMLFSREIRSFSDLVARKARRLCGSSLSQNTQEI